MDAISTKFRTVDLIGKKIIKAIKVGFMIKPNKKLIFTKMNKILVWWNRIDRARIN